MDEARLSVNDTEASSTKVPPERDKEREREEALRQAAAHDEIGGPKGPEPTRFGDWERKGRCIDF